MKEVDLFPPLQKYLQGQGYRVHSEVKNCDLVAFRDTEMIIIELKLQFSLQLVMQAVSRQEISPNVYLAVPLKNPRRYPSAFSSQKKLLRRLGLGLIFIRFLKSKTRVEIVLHPGEPLKFNRPSRQRMIIAEVDGRYAEFNNAGEISTTEKLTAYKQQAIGIAIVLSERESASPSELRQLGLPSKCQRILSSNVYGWFERVDRGVYRLADAGRQALRGYEQEASKIREKIGF